MKTIIKTLFFALFLVAPAIITYTQEREQPPAGGEPRDFRLPPRQEFQLGNGMRVVLIQYGIIPKADVSLVVKTGAIHEEAGAAGVTDLLTKLMKEGTAALDAKVLAREFARMGGELGVNAGMHTTNLAASVLADFAPRCVELIGQVAQQAALPESELPRLKNDLKRENSVARSQPQVQASEAFFGKIYGDHPYGRPMASDAAIDGYTIDQIRAFYNSQFGAQRSVLYVVGKFDEKAVREAVENAFQGWNQGPAVDYPAAAPAVSEEINLMDRPGSPQSTVYMGIPVPDPSSPDYTALDVMDDLLGGSFGSRITSNIREDKGYTYSPYSTVSNQYRSAVWYEQADITIEQTSNALQEVYREVDRLRREAPAEEELNGIKNYKAGIFVLQNSSPGGIIGQLTFMDLHGLGDDYLNNRVRDIHAVSPEQVRQTAEKYLDPEKMLIVIVGDKKQTVPQMEAYKKADKKYQPLAD